LNKDNVSAFTPEECNVYSLLAVLLRLCSEERHGISLSIEQNAALPNRAELVNRVEL